MGTGLWGRGCGDRVAWLRESQGWRKGLQQPRPHTTLLPETLPEPHGEAPSPALASCLVREQLLEPHSLCLLPPPVGRG